MKGLASTRGAGSAALRVGLLAAMLMLATGTSQAASNGGRGSGGGGRTHSGGGDRSHSGDGGRTYGGRGYGGRGYGGGDRSYGGGRTYGGGGSYAGGGRSYSGGGRTYVGDGGRIRGGGGRDYDGGRYYGPYRYRHIHPRTFVSFGIGLGLPYYYPPAYRSYVEPYPVEAGFGTSIDVTNEPPAGCYYYDRFCDRQFSNLDDYTDHLDGQDHAKTIEIVRKDSDDTLRTLEFVDGYWSVKR